MFKKNGSTKNTCLVKCRVEPGMFKEEWLVFVDAVDPKSHANVGVQLFVDHREVTRIQGNPRKHAPASAWVRASLIRAKGSLVQIVLPQPATPLGETILVNKELIDIERRS